MAQVRKRPHRPDDDEIARRIAEKQDWCTREFVASAYQALADAQEAAAVAKDEQSAIEAFEFTKYAGLRAAVSKLPFYQIERAEFDALTVTNADIEAMPQDGPMSSRSVGLKRWRVGASWVLIWANANGTAVLYQPELLDSGSSPLN